MKLLELKKIIDGYLEMNSGRNHDLEVVIPTNMPSVGPRSTTKVKGGYPGIDWEAHMFILFPEKDLTIKQKDK